MAKLTKWLLVIIAPIAITLFFLWKSEKKENSQYSSKIEKYRSDSVFMSEKLRASHESYSKLEKAKTKVEIFYKDKNGSITRNFESKLDHERKLRRLAEMKPNDTVYLQKEDNTPKTLYDTFKNDDFTLRYSIDYYGGIFNVDFDWDLKQKTAIKEHIIYETIYKDKIVYRDKYHHYVSYSYGGVLHDVEFGMFKKNMGFQGGVVFYDKKVLPKVGVSVLF